MDIKPKDCWTLFANPGRLKGILFGLFIVILIIGCRSSNVSHYQSGRSLLDLLLADLGTEIEKCYAPEFNPENHELYIEGFTATLCEIYGEQQFQMVIEHEGKAFFYKEDVDSGCIKIESFRFSTPEVAANLFSILQENRQINSPFLFPTNWIWIRENDYLFLLSSKGSDEALDTLRRTQDVLYKFLDPGDEIESVRIRL